MGLGLYRDLAVGADPGGSEVWSGAGPFRPGTSVGAPPDPLGPQGQNWGLPPFNPLALERAGPRGLPRARLRQHAPRRRDQDRPRLPAAAPVRHPARRRARPTAPMWTIRSRRCSPSLRIESHRARCLVIAEDLGTAPEGFSTPSWRRACSATACCSFERDETGFQPPDAYPALALAVVTTHDLPTFARLVARARHRPARDASASTTPARAAHERERARHRARRFAAALAPRACCRAGAARRSRRSRPRCAISPGRRRAPGRLQVEDVAGELNQANMPGSVDGHPNWRRRLRPTSRAGRAGRGAGRLAAS